MIIKYIRIIGFLNKENERKSKENNVIFSRSLAAHVELEKKNILNV